MYFWLSMFQRYYVALVFIRFRFVLIFHNMSILFFLSDRHFTFLWNFSLNFTYFTFLFEFHFILHKLLDCSKNNLNAINALNTKMSMCVVHTPILLIKHSLAFYDKSLVFWYFPSNFCYCKYSLEFPFTFWLVEFF